MDDRTTLQETAESVSNGTYKSPKQVMKDNVCNSASDLNSFESVVDPKKSIQKEKVKKLKKNEYEIVICPKCKKPLRYYPFHNNFICLTDNIECRISH